MTTRFTYNADGNILTLTAKNPATGDQRTTYLYGTTLADSDIARSDLMRTVIYPDSADGSDQVTYNYNRRGQITAKTDQNGSVHEYEFDLLGRPIGDAVPTLAAGVDGAVRRIDTGYEVRGMVNLVTSYDNAAGSGTPVNQVERTFNNFVQLAEEAQEHDGAVDGSTLSVGYAYANGSANTIRPTSVTYPDGRVLTLSYGSGDDDKLSRIATLDWNGTDVSSYTYLGASSIVKETYPQPSVALDYIGAGNAYSGFDRFGRVIDQKWTGAGGTVDQFRYSYDRNSNRIYRENVMAGQQATPVHLDELYGYDRVNRLTSEHRGQLVSNDRITNHALSQTWQLDAIGNWKQFSNYDQADADSVLVQQRAHNTVNEITEIGETVGDLWPTPVYDRNGNMTTTPQPNDPTQSFTCIWDAWNRLVEVKDGAATVGRYDYDGLRRRIRKFVPGSPDSYQHFYFNSAWELLETRQATTASVPATPQYQYVWSLRYIDAPIVRDDRATSPEEVLYYLGDANFNVTTLIDTSGDPVERYVYDPYGTVTVFSPDWSATRATSDFNITTLYTGRWRDAETWFYDYRTRQYSAMLGRFLCRDVILYNGGLNLYVYNASAPVMRLDPFGMAASVSAQITVTHVRTYIQQIAYGSGQVVGPHERTWKSGASLGLKGTVGRRSDMLYFDKVSAPVVKTAGMELGPPQTPGKSFYKKRGVALKDAAFRPISGDGFCVEVLGLTLPFKEIRRNASVFVTVPLPPISLALSSAGGGTISVNTGVIGIGMFIPFPDTPQWRNLTADFDTTFALSVVIAADGETLVSAGPLPRGKFNDYHMRTFHYPDSYDERDLYFLPAWSVDIQDDYHVIEAMPGGTHYSMFGSGGMYQYSQTGTSDPVPLRGAYF